MQSILGPFINVIESLSHSHTRLFKTEDLYGFIVEQKQKFLSDCIST